MDNIGKEKFADFILSSVGNDDLAALIECKDRLYVAIDDVVKKERDRFLNSVISRVGELLPHVSTVLESSGNGFICKTDSGCWYEVRIEQSFPRTEDGGRGMWWGIYQAPNSDQRGKGISCGLKERNWQSVTLQSETQGVFFDHTNDIKGSIAILQEDHVRLAEYAAKDIISNISAVKDRIEILTTINNHDYSAP